MKVAMIERTFVGAVATIGLAAMAACQVSDADQRRAVSAASGLGGALAAARPDYGPSEQEEAPDEEDVEVEEGPVKDPPKKKVRLTQPECEQSHGDLVNICANDGRVSCNEILGPSADEYAEGTICYAMSCTADGRLRACRGEIRERGTCVPFANSCMNYAHP